MAKFCKRGPLIGGEIESVAGLRLNCVKLRINGYFGNLTFLPEKNLLQNFKLFKKSFPATKDLDFAYSGLRHIFEMLSMTFVFPSISFCSHSASYFLSVGFVLGKYL